MSRSMGWTSTSRLQLGNPTVLLSLLVTLAGQSDFQVLLFELNLILFSKINDSFIFVKNAELYGFPKLTNESITS